MTGLPDPNKVTAEFGGAQHDGRILALEGGGGFMRVEVQGAPALAAGDTVVLEMHDGARFRVTVIEPLEGGAQADAAGFRMKLLAKERA